MPRVIITNTAVADIVETWYYDLDAAEFDLLISGTPGYAESIVNMDAGEFVSSYTGISGNEHDRANFQWEVVQ